MIKKYLEFIKESKEDIDNICKKYDIENYTLNDDGSIDVDGDVYLCKYDISRLPLKFRNVNGNFGCYDNNLVSLDDCPEVVGGDFYIYNNNLVDLKGCPKEICGDFYCYNNLLTSLEGCSNIVGGNFNCNINKLTSFKGCPQHIGGNFNCRNNDIRDFYGFPDFWDGELYIKGNPIFEIYDIFNKNNRCTELLNTTRTIIGDKIRVEGILDVADAMNIKLPENWKEQIKSYKLIQ